MNFLQLSHFLDNILYTWAAGGVLQPTPLNEIPHTIRHRYSVHWSSWPLTCQYSSTCTQTVIVRKDRGTCVNLTHSIIQCQPFLSIRERLLKGYLKCDAREGKYVTFCRSLELLASIKEFRSHPSWGAPSVSHIGQRCLSKVSKSEVSDFCFQVAANEYVYLGKHSCKVYENIGGNCSPLSNRHGTSLASVGVECPLQSEATSTRV